MGSLPRPLYNKKNCLLGSLSFLMERVMAILSHLIEM